MNPIDLSGVIPGEQYIPAPEDPEPDFSVLVEADPSEATSRDFDSRAGDDLEGLLYLGALTDTVDVGGHTIVIRTLKIGEELACGQLLRPYEGTVSAAKANLVARAAAAIESVDGQPLHTALGPGDTLSVITAKFQYILNNWYWPVIEEVFMASERLLSRQQQAMKDALGK